MAVPAGVEGVVVAGGEAGVVEDQRGFGGAGLKFEVDDCVNAGVPVSGAPCLDDSLVGHEFDVAALDFGAEEAEGSAGGGVDGGGKSREGGELLLVEDGFIEAVRAGFEVDLVVDGGEGLMGGRGGLFCCGWLLGAG